MCGVCSPGGHQGGGGLAGTQLLFHYQPNVTGPVTHWAKQDKSRGWGVCSTCRGRAAWVGEDSSCSRNKRAIQHTYGKKGERELGFNWVSTNRDILLLAQQFFKSCSILVLGLER